jgi:hypothetical protein
MNQKKVFLDGLSQPRVHAYATLFRAFMMDPLNTGQLAPIALPAVTPAAAVPAAPQGAVRVN